MSKIVVGDRVAYSARWLRSTGQIASVDDIGHARGVVKELKPLGSITLAIVDWGKWRDVASEKVNVCNLAKVGPNRDYCNCD